MNNCNNYPFRQCKRWGLAILLLAGIMSLFALYYYINPEHSIWMPKCMFRFFTGWDCPACGGQRAVHAVLHGQWRMAIRYNPFLLISLPYLTVVAYTTFSTTRYARRLKTTAQHPWVIKTYILLFFCWWVFRNTSWWIGAS